MSCSPDTEITWAHVKVIADRIDALAITYSTPDYETLESVTDMPFIFDNKVDFAGAVAFQVSPGTNSVTQQYLTGALTSTTAFPLHAVLDEMGKNSELILVVEEDGCWCKTIFKVDTTTSIPRLKQIGELGCCQSLFVPQPGDLLDREQNIIPAAYVETYVESGNPSSTEWVTKPACVAETTEAGFKFSSAEPEALLIWCSRDITGYFTWPARSRYMTKMIEKLNFILSCSNSGGAAKDEVRRKLFDGEAAPQYVPEGCEIRICDLINDRRLRGIMDDTNPGCIIEGCDTGYVEVGSIAPPNYPWDELTCGGANCDGNGPKFYCQTLLDLEHILDIAEIGLRSKSETHNCHAPCFCGLVLECQTKSGTGEWCPYEFAGLGYVKQYKDIRRYCDPESGELECIEEDILEFRDGILEYRNGIPVENPCGIDEIYIDTNCVDDESNSYEFCGFASEAVSTFGETPPWVALRSAATSQKSSASYVASETCTAFSGTSYKYADVTTRAATAQTQDLKWRIRLEDTFVCSGDNADLETSVRRTELKEGVTTVTTEPVTLAYSEEDETWVSEWKEIIAPAWNSTDPAVNSIEVDHVTGKIQCPLDCVII